MQIFQRSSRPQRKPKALFAKPPRPFRAGDRIRCTTGQAKGQLGTVVRRPYYFRITIHAGPDQVWVLFDGDRAATKTRRMAIERADSAPR